MQQRHCGPDPPSTYTDPVTSSEQDNGPTLFSEPANQGDQAKEPALTLPLGPHTQLKTYDPDDLESGVADLSSRSSSSGEYGKDPDLE